MIKLLSTVAIITAITLAPFANAQEAMKRENVTYIGVTLVKFKPGKVRAARDHIEKYFVPASAEAGTPRPITLHMQSGTWDNINFRAQENGMADFEWDRSPNGIKFRAALAKLNGGEENASKIFAEYQSMIATRAREIGHRHVTPAED